MCTWLRTDTDEPACAFHSLPCLAPPRPVYSLSSRRDRSSPSSSDDEDADSANASSAGAAAAERFGLASSSTGRYLKFTAEKEVIALLEKAAKADNSSSSSSRGSGGREGVGGSRVVLHFSHPEFARCKIMDGHLEVSRQGAGWEFRDDTLAPNEGLTLSNPPPPPSSPLPSCD